MPPKSDLGRCLVTPTASFLLDEETLINPKRKINISYDSHLIEKSVEVEVLATFLHFACTEDYVMLTSEIIKCLLKIHRDDSYLSY